MKVKMLTALAGNKHSLKKGDTAELDDKMAQQLIDKGFAEKAQQKKKKKSQKRQTAQYQPQETRETPQEG